jgi:hypothetical protein
MGEICKGFLFTGLKVVPQPDTRTATTAISASLGTDPDGMKVMRL